jgi:phosphatidylglycerol:prolipoprotein diacylglycerol transferase
MIDPVIFSFDIGSFSLTLRWYGVLVMSGLLVGAWIADKEIARRGGDPDLLWDMLIWIVPAGVIGARAWYVINDILGGGQYFIAEPMRAFYISQGGLHIYGAVLAGVYVAHRYLRRRGKDFLLYMDALAPGLLVGQAVGRFANFINQELYGPPTEQPWGVPISADHRIAPWNDLARYPEESTRFHPTFFYEALWNVIGAGILIWIGRHFKKRVKPGVMIALWLIWAGIGRFWIEFFRPDQPRIGSSDISITRVVAAAMALFGVLVILAKYKVVKVPGIPTGPDYYSRRK